MTTTPTPAQRLDALCGALAYPVGRSATFATVLDLARIVRDLHRDAQQPQEADPFPPGGIVTVRDFGAGTVVTANGDYRTVRINGADVEYHVSWLRPWPEPSPAPVSQPTTPGSVAWTRDGGICSLTDDDTDPWLGVAGDRTAWCFSAPELLALVVVRVFDAGTGELRPSFDAGTIDHAFRPVAAHPDDDECTHRADGTDATYCGAPASAHAESGA